MWKLWCLYFLHIALQKCTLSRQVFILQCSVGQSKNVNIIKSVQNIIFEEGGGEGGVNENTYWSHDKLHILT